jgi:hypothetical protein
MKLSSLKKMNTEELKVILDASRLYWSTNCVEGSIANLHGADLCEADLHGADLRRADLCEADLHGVDLHGANLCEADLHGVDLHGANLYEANLYRANLRRADLRRADLHGADLRRADLRRADLFGVDLFGVDLSEVRLAGAIGNMREIRSMQIEEHSIVYTSDQLVVGCKQYPIEEWKNPLFLNERERKLWDECSPLIWAILEKYPAKSC